MWRIRKKEQDVRQNSSKIKCPVRRTFHCHVKTKNGNFQIKDEKLATLTPFFGGSVAHHGPRGSCAQVNGEFFNGQCRNWMMFNLRKLLKNILNCDIVTINYTN